MKQRIKVRNTGLFVQVTIMAASTLPPIVKDAPHSKKVWALIDTGARRTVIKNSVSIDLGLKPIGEERMNTAGDPIKCQQFLIKLIIPKFLYTDNHRITSMPLTNQTDIGCLIGMDILQHCHLTYNGPKRQCSLSQS